MMKIVNYGPVQETEQSLRENMVTPLSNETCLANLSRRHLAGEISTKEYLQRERQLLPRIRQHPSFLERVLRELAGELVADEIAKQSRISPAP